MGRLVLAPFRDLRYDPARVGDLGTVVAPPYDMLDVGTVAALRRANQHNVVRLILPRASPESYTSVSRRLGLWRRTGHLAADPQAALYLYEYVVGAVCVRGLVGVVALRAEAERVILGHEDVRPGPVEDRVALMSRTRTNLEPILLVHSATSELRRLVGVLADGPALADLTSSDGGRHRLWSSSDPAVLAGIARELSDGQALIADGHHRYAAYLRLQANRSPTAPAETSPWDFGLAMLVDQGSCRLEVGAIHRVVPDATLASLRDRAAPEARWEAASSSDQAFEGRDHLADDPGRAALVLTDGRVWATVSMPRTDPVDAVVAQDLLSRCGIPEDRLEYVHRVDEGVSRVASRPGVLIVTRPPSLETVMRKAARGELLPRKSTSFGPKPLMGLVMRDLRDESV